MQVTVESSRVVHGVDHLHVVATNGGITAQPLDFALAGAPVDIPPAQTFTLVFGADRQGAVTVVVDAQDATQRSLSTASTRGFTAYHLFETGDVATCSSTCGGFKCYYCGR